MAIYYVRNDGNDSNTGTGPAPNQAWQNIQKALGSTSGLVGGDIVYVAPGRYTEYVGISITSPSSQVRIVGDPSASQFSGITPGVVLWTVMTASGANITTYLLAGTSKSNLSFENFYFELTNLSNNQFYMNLATCQNIQFKKCLIDANGASTNTNILTISAPAGQALNATIDSCIFNNGAQQLQLYGTSGVTDTTVVKNCLFIGSKSSALLPTSLNANIVNNTFVGAVGAIISNPTSSIPSTIKNCLFVSVNTGAFWGANVGTTATFCRVIGSGGLNNVTVGATNSTLGANGLDNGYRQLHNLQSIFPTGSTLNSVNTSFGNATGAPTTDLFDVAWSGTSPDAGAITYRNLGTITPIYQPTERNAGTITIAPGSTSQSIEVYLGVTGLTASTAGLSARYNRSRTASVNIPLVARTIGQAWTSGGFAEVDAVNMPGIYRVDIPDAALAAGADDVTLVVRGASGTNGAVMTIKLSSGGLTSAQTASAVWGASVAGYNTATDFGGVVNEIRNVVGSTEQYVLDVPNQVWEELTDNHDTHGTYGWNVLRADAPSKEGLVTLHQSGGVSRVDADIHAIANDTDAALELKGALLHNGTDYISADLLSPNVPTSNLRMGPYKVVADQDKQEINVDILTGASLPVVLQLVDAMGTGIPLSGATLSVKVYNTSGTLISTYPGTASYSDAGFVTFTLDTVVTASPGTYYVTVTRTTGATDTSIYGGLRLYVRSN